MDEQSLTVFSIDDHIAFFTQVHDQVHPFEVESLKKSSDYSAMAIIAGTDSDQKLRIRFSL